MELCAYCGEETKLATRGVPVCLSCSLQGRVSQSNLPEIKRPSCFLYNVFLTPKLGYVPPIGTLVMS